MRTYDLSPMFRYSVGFDRMQTLMDAALSRSEATYPPYNIESNGENIYRISTAVAGFNKKELNISVEGDTLMITGEKSGVESDHSYLHRGIAGRNFQLKFNLAEHIKISGANLENGVLAIDLERELPESLKPRNIKIGSGSVKSLASKAKAMVGVEQQMV